MWQRRLSTESAFCRALVACGYLTEAQMRRAAERYRLGMSRDGGVIFWQKDQLEQSDTVSPLLELRATPEQKRRKIDLVDFLFESPPK